MPHAAQPRDAGHRHRDRAADRRVARPDSGDGCRAGASLHVQDGCHRRDRAADRDVRVGHLRRGLHRHPVPDSRRADRRAHAVGRLHHGAARTGGEGAGMDPGRGARRRHALRGDHDAADAAARQLRIAFLDTGVFRDPAVRFDQRHRARARRFGQCADQPGDRASRRVGRHGSHLWRLPVHLRLADSRRRHRIPGGDGGRLRRRRGAGAAGTGICRKAHREDRRSPYRAAEVARDRKSRRDVSALEPARHDHRPHPRRRSDDRIVCQLRRRGTVRTAQERDGQRRRRGYRRAPGRRDRLRGRRAGPVCWRLASREAAPRR